jgi:hypothetical protein
MGSVFIGLLSAILEAETTTKAGIIVDGQWSNSDDQR